jgi:DNA recombination protein RmuC
MDGSASTAAYAALLAAGCVAALVAVLLRRLTGQEADLRELRRSLEAVRAEKAGLETRLATTLETLAQERRQGEEKLALVAQARQEMADRFAVLAEDIMARHGERFSAQNREQIEGALGPLRERMAQFQQGLQLAHEESMKDRTTLAEQIRSLTRTSAEMSSETQNLTRALMGEAQVQGAWGEMILATILEKSGLREGEEYVAQEGLTAEDGARVRPDVIVNLPGGEKIVVDSKVSLKAFEDHVNAATPAERKTALQRHLTSMRAHIRTLGSKDYQEAAGSRLDYVLMFVPIEGALAAAFQADPGLTSLAVECNVAIATPTTLMIALRTVANVWKVERRNRNAEQIASRAGLLYDKFCGFVADMGEIQKHLGRTRDAYDEAMKKLSLGRGSLAVQAEQLKALGAKATKTLPENVVPEA